jgi:hypothetical protein
VIYVLTRGTGKALMLSSMADIQSHDVDPSSNQNGRLFVIISSWNGCFGRTLLLLNNNTMVDVFHG